MEKKERDLPQSYDKNKKTDTKFKQKVKRATYRSPEYNVQPFWRIGLAEFLLTDTSEKHKLGKGRLGLLPVKYCIQQFRAEVVNLSANQMPP